jgi:hypothetical protein
MTFNNVFLTMSIAFAALLPLLLLTRPAKAAAGPAH